jgi:hypothetical protein
MAFSVQIFTLLVVISLMVVDIFSTKFYLNWMQNVQNMRTIYLYPEEKCGSHWTYTNIMHNTYMTLLGHLLYQTSYKVVKKYEKSRYKLIYTLKKSMTITKPITMQLTLQLSIMNSLLNSIKILQWFSHQY